MGDFSISDIIMIVLHDSGQFSQPIRGQQCIADKGINQSQVSSGNWSENLNHEQNYHSHIFGLNVLNREPTKRLT